MNIQALYIIAALGTILSLGTIIASAVVDQIGGAGSHLVDAIGGFVSMFIWIGFALGARNVTYISNGVVFSYQNPTLFGIGVMMAIIMLLIGILGTGFLVDIRDMEGVNY